MLPGNGFGLWLGFCFYGGRGCSFQPEGGRQFPVVFSGQAIFFRGLEANVFFPWFSPGAGRSGLGGGGGFLHRVF
jgi:hypothetical protein